MKAVAFIPARGGSARVHGKNLRTVGHVPLLGRAVDVAFSADCQPVVSTNDPQIRRYAETLALVDVPGSALPPGAVGTVRMTVQIHDRPAELADAHAQIEAAIAHWWDGLSAEERPDAVVLLQPTSPFRTAEHVRRALELLERGYDCAVGVWDISQTNAFRGTLSFKPLFDLDGPGCYEPARAVGLRPRSQDIRGSMYAENGALYAWTRAHWERVRDRMWGEYVAPVFMDEIESMDVDTEEDLTICDSIAFATGR